MLTYTNEQGEAVEASIVTLGSTVRTHDQEAVRRSAHQAFLGLEQWLLQNGLLELVKRRNHFARSLGYKTFLITRLPKREDDH